MERIYIKLRHFIELEHKKQVGRYQNSNKESNSLIIICLIWKKQESFWKSLVKRKNIFVYWSNTIIHGTKFPSQLTLLVRLPLRIHKIWLIKSRLNRILSMHMEQLLASTNPSLFQLRS